MNNVKKSITEYVKPKVTLNKLDDKITTDAGVPQRDYMSELLSSLYNAQALEPKPKN